MLRRDRPRDTTEATGLSPVLRLIVLHLMTLFVFTLPIEQITSLPGIGSITRLIGLITVPFALLALVEGRRVRFRIPTVFLLASAAFVVWNVASYFWSVYPSRTLSPAITSVQLLVFVWLVAEFCHSSGALARLMQAFVLGNLVALGNAMLLLFQETYVVRDTGRDPNEFATFLALGIPLAAWLVARGGSGLLRAVNLAYPVFVVVGIILSASRGGLLVALVAVTAIPFMVAGMRLVRRVMLTLLLAATIGLTFTVVPTVFPQLQANLDRLGDAGSELTEGTLTGRTLIWREAVRIIQTSPLVGVGLGAAQPLYAETSLGRERVAHNAFLQVATETGGIGVLLFLSMIAMAATSAFSIDPKYRPFALVFLASLLIGMMPLSIALKKPTWFALALLAHQVPIVATLRRHPNIH